MAQRIIFSPSFSGQVYKGTEFCQKPTAKMDWQALGTQGLVRLLESLMGKRPHEAEPVSRLVAFAGAVRRHFAHKGDCPVGKSFALSALNTAKEMLRWRDELAFCGYSFDAYGVSDRLDSLNDIEREFEASDCHDGLAERTWEVIRWAECQSSDRFSCYDITTTTPVDTFHPTIAHLINTLGTHGALLRNIDPAPDNALTDKTDGGNGWADDCHAHRIHILHFDDKKDADEYLALYGDALPNPWGEPASPTLWINASNSTADNWLMRYGQKRSGSACQGAYTVLSQILPLTIKIQREPLDIQSLLDWLQMPVSPISRQLRRVLADTMVSTGGFHNDKCRAATKGYIESLGTDAARQAREKKSIELFLPSGCPALGQKDGIGLEKLGALLKGLSDWANKKAAAMDGAGQNRHIISQLRNVSLLAKSMSSLAENEESEMVDWFTIDSWLSSLPAPAPDTQYEAKVGCRTVIGSPSDMSDKSALTVWTNLVGDATQKRDCDFLTSDEREKLSKAIKFWETEKEDEYLNSQNNLPLALSERLIIAYYDREYGLPVNKHPLILQLEGRYDGKKDIPIAELTTEASIPENDLLDTQRVDNRRESLTVNISAPQSLKWPKTLSYTALDLVINHPFDYVMERMLHINATPRAQLSNVNTTKGKVAHAIIERICQPRGDDSTTTSRQIEERIDKEFDRLFDETIRACGALLLKDELRPDLFLMKSQLRKCVETLSAILRLNHLEVTACEKEISTSLALLDMKSDEDDIRGDIDMTLVDTRDGSNVIFDFKWTDNVKTFKEKLAKNEAIQLELYKQMLTNVTHKKVSKVAYFIMPAGKLLSCDKFEGGDSEKVESERLPDSAVVRQVVNAFHYRKKQIESGIVELGEGQAADELDYVKDTERLNLLPLKTEARKGDDVVVKSANRFTAFTPLRR